MGTPTSGSVNNSTGYSLQNFYYAGYLQDDFKVTSKFTINWGIRYETESPLHRTAQHAQLLRFRRSESGAEPTLSGFDRCARVRQSGDGPLCVRLEKNNVSPRFGFAWSTFRNTVIRGGGGLFFAPLTISNSDTGFAPNSATARPRIW